MRFTLKAIDDELHRLGHDVHGERGDGYFWKGEASNWLDRTVNEAKVSSLTLEDWIGEFNRLKTLNDKMMAGKGPKKAADSKPPGARPRKINREPLECGRRTPGVPSRFITVDYDVKPSGNK